MGKKESSKHKCRQCGACCKRWGANTLGALREDIHLWEENNAEYLLDMVGWLGDNGDLWFAPRGGEEKRWQCPFLREIPYTTRYFCEIYQLRPTVCREYTGTKGVGECGNDMEGS